MMTLAPKRKPQARAAGPKLCFFSGIDAATGQYRQPPMTVAELAELARRGMHDPLPRPAPRRSGAGRRHDKQPAGWVKRPQDLAEAGWGVIFAPTVTLEVRKALKPLLALRRRQASRKRKGLYKEMTYRAGETKTRFLLRHGCGPGPADPERMPYYLLLVGDPEEIPFDFQYQLDIEYAVGRVHFEDPRDYGLYARTVVAAESGEVRRSAGAVFFGPSNPGDHLSALSANQLAAPLAASLAGRLAGWSVRTVLGTEATKARLGALMRGREKPALLFTAGHGLCLDLRDPRQAKLQGSLICQDWPGLGQDIETKQCFGAEDVPKDASIAGLIAFHFSCYGAGTPKWDDFGSPLPGRRIKIARQAFLSGLSRCLLAHPRGGALAVIAHVDCASSWSFLGLDRLGQTLRPVFESALQRLAEGYPIGFAMEYFNACYAELATELHHELLRPHGGRDRRLAQLWTGRNDARNYVVLGDPAVRLALAPRARAR